MILTGISDEAGATADAQIRAHQSLGWNSLESRFVEVKGFEKGSIHEIPQAAFDRFASQLDEAGITVCGVGSTIGNWAHSILDPFSITEGEIGRCVERMHRLGSKIVRVMSYAILKEGDDDAPEQHKEERFRRMREIKRRFDEAGITAVHENCMNYGGLSVPHALELQENVPGLKWVFDTGNPVFNADRSKPKPYPRQNPWEFYQALREHIAHVHVKDGRWDAERNDCVFTMPGDGEAEVERVLADLAANGYSGYISIEPHVATVFHDLDEKNDDPEAKARAMFDSYLEYGRQMKDMVARVTSAV